MIAINQQSLFSLQLPLKEDSSKKNLAQTFRYSHTQQWRNGVWTKNGKTCMLNALHIQSNRNLSIIQRILVCIAHARPLWKQPNCNIIVIIIYVVHILLFFVHRNNTSWWLLLSLCRYVGNVGWGFAWRTWPNQQQMAELKLNEQWTQHLWSLIPPVHCPARIDTVYIIIGTIYNNMHIWMKSFELEFEAFVHTYIYIIYIFIIQKFHFECSIWRVVYFAYYK